MNASRKVFALIGAGLIALIALWTFQPSGAPIAGQERGELGKPGMMGGAVGYWQQLLQDEKGEIPPDGLMRARAQMAASSAGGRGAGLAAAGLTRTSWIWLGPGNIGGAVTAIVFHPQFASNQTMWAGTAGGGIWKSTNGGASWSPVDDFLANLAVSDMLIDPTNAKTIYASTGEQISGGATRGAGFSRAPTAGVTGRNLQRPLMPTTGRQSMRWQSRRMAPRS